MGNQDQRRIANLSDGHEVLDRVEWHLGKDMRIDDDGAVEPEQQRVAIGRRLGHHRAADISRGTGLVVDHDLLAKALAQPVRNHTGAGIRNAARRERHDQPDRARRVVLREGAGAGYGRRGDGDGNGA
ncbi:hypothetical protein D3C86_1476730 [compost metagenome]